MITSKLPGASRLSVSRDLLLWLKAAEGIPKGDHQPKARELKVAHGMRVR